MIGKEIRFLLVHSSIYGLGTVVAQIVSFLLLPLYTRYLTPADYGTLQTVEVSCGMIGIVVTIGIARALSRFYYESEDIKDRNRVVSTAFVTYGVVALLAAPLLLFASDPIGKILLGSHEHGHLFRIAFLSMLVGAFTDINMMHLRLLKKPHIFISITVSRLLCLIVLNILFIVYYHMGIQGILYSSLVVSGIYSAGLTVSTLLKTGMNFSLNLSRQLAMYSLPIIPSQLGNTVVKQSDKYFVLYLMSVADMGIYTLALKIGNAVHHFLTIPFNMAYIPRRFEIMKREDAERIYSRIFTYYVFLVGYVGLFISVLIPEILHFMVTPGYLGAKEIVPLVVLSMVIFGTHYHFDFGILHSKRTKYLSYIGIVSAAVQIGLNYLLIRKYGFFGAVWSSIISLALQAFLLYAVSHKLFPIEYEFGRIFKYLSVAMIFYGISTQVRPHGIFVALILKLIILLLFPVVLMALGIVTSSERERIREIYTNRLRPFLSGKAAALKP
jgi:O-antigen/teichoic acid export membrane protein